jgi:hypothetical protein
VEEEGGKRERSKKREKKEEMLARNQYPFALLVGTYNASVAMENNIIAI